MLFPDAYEFVFSSSSASPVRKTFPVALSHSTINLSSPARTFTLSVITLWSIMDVTPATHTASAEKSVSPFSLSQMRVLRVSPSSTWMNTMSAPFGNKGCVPRAVPVF